MREGRIYGPLLALSSVASGQDPSTWTIPTGANVKAKLTADEHSFVGNHWTDFSNNYGGCQVNTGDPISTTF